MSELKWKKMPNYPKWQGLIGSKAIVALIFDPGKCFRMWVDVGDGWQESKCINQPDPTTVKEAKAMCIAAYEQLAAEKEVRECLN